ncbi:MAG: FKBP-type peptidyl-prolyl cis-trans isomerase [Candidatus Aenigmarchaeota archaeon]|nr:FKBP-type peptidyl-prolyl cis-trans isomerase [Candidatus Aenigmarchaeota archaeon]
MQNGDFVKINYVGRVKETNEVFDLTDEAVAKKEKIELQNIIYGPVTVIIGEKMILPALEDEIKNMNTGETKKIELDSQKAFGPRDSRLIKVFSESEFIKNDMNPIPGLTVNVNGLRGRVLSSSGGRVQVDFNHPLAGKNLVYDMTCIGPVEGDEDRTKALVQYYAGVKPDMLRVSVKDSQAVVTLPPKNAVPSEIKERVSKEIMKWVKLVSVKFEEIYNKSDSAAKNAETAVV